MYDDAGRLWRTIEHRHGYTDTANPTVMHTGDKVTETRYTLGGRTAQTLGPPVDVTAFDWSGADSTKSVTSYGYDDAGRQVTVTAPDDGVTTTAYDPDGRTASVTAPGGYETSYVYDAAGRRTGVVTPSGLTGSGAPATVTAVTGYDAAGRVVSESDPHTPVSGTADPSTRYTAYTPGGRVDTVTDANGNTVTYGYDSRGNRTSRTATDDAGSPVVESWTWNKADQELTHTVPPPRAGAASMTTTSTYDPDYGWLATVTDPTARVQTHAYYSDGTLKQTAFTRASDAAVVNRFWVNGRGWRTKSTSTTGVAAAKTWSSTYDRAGQKTAEVNPQGTISHTYGLAGEQLTLGYPDGVASSSYLHDPAGRLTDVSVTSGGITVPYATYTYDAAGRQASELIHAAGGATRTWGYDDAGRLDAFTEVLPNTVSTWETYTAGLTYRADGRLATEKVNSDPKVTYGYDDAGQLTSAGDGSGGAPDRSWTYGTRGNRLTTVEDGVTTTYTTNPNASVAKTTEGTHTVTYAYDDAGRRTTATAKTGTTQTGSTTITSTTEGYAGLIVVSATGATTTSETRGYDAEGKLIKSDTGGTTVRHYQWDTTQAIPQIIDARDSGATWFRATWGNQRIAFKSGTANPQWFQYDARGSVIRTDPTNTDVVIGPQRYTPFGETGLPTAADRIGYRGELTASGLIHLRARNYDPTSGQFVSEDPVDGIDGAPTVASEHHYANNDPLNLTDPRGLVPSDLSMELTQEQIGEILDHLTNLAKRTYSSIDMSAANMSGRCAGAGLIIPFFEKYVGADLLNGSACILVDREAYWYGAAGAAAGFGIGYTRGERASVNVSAGKFYSNGSGSNYRGWSFCGSLGATFIPAVIGGAVGGAGVGVEVCLSLKSDPSLALLHLQSPFSGVWSVTTGVSWGTRVFGFEGKLMHGGITRLMDRKVQKTRWIPLVGDIDLICGAINVAFLQSQGPNYFPCVDPG